VRFDAQIQAGIGKRARRQNKITEPLSDLHKIRFDFEETTLELRLSRIGADSARL